MVATWSEVVLDMIFKTQAIVSLSSAKAEFHSMTKCNSINIVLKGSVSRRQYDFWWTQVPKNTSESEGVGRMKHLQIK